MPIAEREDRPRHGDGDCGGKEHDSSTPVGVIDMEPGK
jgi:hypothetical protein